MFGWIKWGVVLCLLMQSPLWADDVFLRVLHSNDVYGQLTRRDGQAGMAARVWMMRHLSANGTALIVDAGDALGPDPLSRFDDGQTMTAAMTLAGYTAMVPGNHELSLGWPVINKRLEESGFPMLAANMVKSDSSRAPLPGTHLVEINGIRVGLVGVLAPKVANLVDPKILSGLTLADPVVVANQALVTLKQNGADFMVVLAHMTEQEALVFARKLDGVVLVVAGGFGGLDQASRVPGVVRLFNGTTVVTTPRYGLYLGRVVVKFDAVSGQPLQLVSIKSDPIHIDETVLADGETANLVGDLERRYEDVAGKEIGQIQASTQVAQGQVVAGLMRQHARAEVGVVNQGGLGLVPVNASLKVRDIDRLIRFDDRLVKMTLTGKQLKAAGLKSQRVSRDEARLIFVGFDPKLGTVNGRPVTDDETYRLAVPEFLADGGDGYVEFGEGKSVVRTGVGLRSLVVAALQNGAVLSENRFSQREPKGVWRANWGVEGAFNRNYIDGTTLAYRREKEGVSFLSGETSVSWNANLHLVLARDMGQQVVQMENRVAFGQVGTTFGNLDKSEDRLDSDLTYHYRAKTFVANPFVSVGISTALTDTDGQRPFLLRGSTGFQRRFLNMLGVRLGARAQRDFAADESDAGLEVGLDFKRSLGKEGQLTSRVRSFFGVTDRRVVSFENYNTLGFPLAGSLSLAVRQSNFLYRVNKIRNMPIAGFAFRWDLTLGLIYQLGWKWY